MDTDWDLHAVVRGCSSAVSSSYTTTTTTTTTPLDSYNNQTSTFYKESCTSFFPDLYQPRIDNSIEQLLNNLYHPLHFPNVQKPPSSPQSIPVSPLSVLGGLQDPPYYQQKLQKQEDERPFVGKQQSLGLSRCITTHAQGTTKFKKRKNQIKRVCQVPAEGASSDMWCWRKYGQKPIKGSPYPRGYYKCSTSKGCLARKQVERNKSDPGMLIITYTGEHNHPTPTHRNSLSGSSRNKTTVNNPTPISPTKETLEEFDTDEDTTNFDVSEVVIDGDILDVFSDHHVTSDTSPSFPWLSNNVAATTTAAAGGC
ncbi:hypothetical protein M8C21_020890 [Ambrosia artemisiifolia]|uniref:WRKY domain-containing protein n=1 Tax=Ambrosia artemisiifolia TaxID=4212 RepID=A0AAD5GHQ9_AMBAR|nr:hypothetical protein M8C21_020890 [Ambrosia artemisiifolia]